MLHAACVHMAWLRACEYSVSLSVDSTTLTVRLLICTAAPGWQALTPCSTRICDVKMLTMLTVQFQM